MKQLFRDLAINVVASIIAPLIVLGFPALFSYWTSDEVFIDVKHATEQYGTLRLDRLDATNNGSYAVSPLTFVGNVSGIRVLSTVKVGTVRTEIAVDKPRPLWSGSLVPDQTLTVTLVSRNGGVEGDIRAQFGGVYTVIDSSGLPKQRRVVVRSAEQAEVATYHAAGKIAGAVFAFMAIISVILWIRRRTRKEKAPG